jgi:acyl-homoserine lactone acylase PvdQ
LQLPSIWYQAELSSPDNFLVGATLPGVPVVALGRTHDLAWSVTYGTADISDYFVEQVVNGKYRHGVVEPMTLPMASYSSDRTDVFRSITPREWKNWSMEFMTHSPLL